MKNIFRLTTCLMIFIFLFSVRLVSSQANQDGSMPQFLFPDFVSGTVKLANGQTRKLPLNYNTISEKVVFEQNDKIFDLLNIDKVDTVIINECRFVPVGDLFYEVLVSAPVAVFVQHKGSLIPPGKPAAYGGTSQVSSSTYLSGVQLSSGYYNLQLPADYQVKVDPFYWVRIDGKMNNVISEKQFIKLFPGKEQDIKNYIKKYRIKFSRIPDVKRLGQFINGQVSM